MKHKAAVTVVAVAAVLFAFALEPFERLLQKSAAEDIATPGNFATQSSSDWNEQAPVDTGPAIAALKSGVFSEADRQIAGSAVNAYDALQIINRAGHSCASLTDITTRQDSTLATCSNGEKYVVAKLSGEGIKEVAMKCSAMSELGVSC